MRWQGLLVCGCVAFSMSIWSCSGSSSPGDAGNNPDSGGNPGNDSGNPPFDAGNLSQGASDLAAAVCGKIGSCTPFAIKLVYGDVTSCASRFVLSVSPEVGINGTGGLTQGQLEACAAGFSNETCNDLYDGVQPAGCNVTGTLPNGTPCGVGLQCQTGYCKLTSGASCGVCATKSTAGNSCGQNSDCPSGYYCPKGANPVCTAYSTQGQACSADAGVFCQGQYYCDTTTNNCQTPSTTVGSHCTLGNALICAAGAGLYCNGSTCQPFGLSDPGGQCGLVSLLPPTAVLCGDGGACGLTSQYAGVCANPAADGTACATDGGVPSCLSPATCVNGLCTLPGPGNCH
jgi:hypothetical protein